ncbi:MAG: cysteine synthase family protein [Ignavibacteriae bacterium]|nr:cysteine synthase family protein [Ignavibacteriota bacterium]
MKYYNNVLELIGNTPLIKLNELTKGFKATVFGKMESFNPGGSVKDRIGLAMIEKAEQEGKIKPGGTIIEATSGNTGIGLALTAAVKGYKSIIVVTDKVSKEKQNYLKALGSEVIVVPKSVPHDSPEYYINKAISIAESTPNSFYTGQYTNFANPDAHYKTTGPEIWEATEGKITHFVAGLGTGGTITGTAKYLKEKNPDIQVIAADMIGSIAKKYKEEGTTGEVAPYLVEGIGLDIIPEIMDFDLIDRVVEVNDKDSIHYCRELTRREGIFCGASTGTFAKVAFDIAKGLDEKGVVVFIVCDIGERYLSKFHNEEWLKQNNAI